ncbi:DUF4190 domain-containing protein [Cellulomonas sp. NPDC089187]|uniref:DUF4190 domain-containing protein n=1 Tax=Cellulomonas sp. NPDC089187 TaxID=3154970 RepID=UPI0034244A4B
MSTPTDPPSPYGPAGTPRADDPAVDHAPAAEQDEFGSPEGSQGDRVAPGQPAPQAPEAAPGPWSVAPTAGESSPVDPYAAAAGPHAVDPYATGIGQYPGGPAADPYATDPYAAPYSSSADGSIPGSLATPYDPYSPAPAQPAFPGDPYAPGSSPYAGSYASPVGPQPYGAGSGYPYPAGQPSMPPTYGAPAHGQPPVPGYLPVYAPVVTYPKNSLGVWSLVLGLVGVVLFWALCPGLAAVGAVITGHLSRSAARRGEANNGGMALAGVILGYVGIGLWVLLFLASFLPSMY